MKEINRCADRLSELFLKDLNKIYAEIDVLYEMQNRDENKSIELNREIVETFINLTMIAARFNDKFDAILQWKNNDPFKKSFIKLLSNAHFSFKGDLLCCKEKLCSEMKE